jgi:hypothetical protein
MQVCIPLPSLLTETVGVFLDARRRELHERSLTEAVAIWIANVLADPLRQALLQCMDSPECSIEIVDRREFPELPAEALRLAGEEERRRYESATAVVAIRAFHRFEHPLLGMLFPRAVSQAVVEATGGVAMEPAVPRLRSLDSQITYPSDGSIVIAQFIDVIELRGIRGELALRTTGMGRFGLPDFLLDAVTRRSVPELCWLLHGIGQRVLTEALRCRDSGLDAMREIPMRLSWLGEGLLEVRPPRAFRDPAAWADTMPEMLCGYRRSA